MTFPNYKNKHEKDSFFSPADFVEYRRKMGVDDISEPPEGIILCYTGNVIEYVAGKHPVTEVNSFPGKLLLLNETENRVGIIGNFGFGAPVVITVLEELIAFGVKKFVSIGLAGTLQKDLSAGDIVVCDKAIRDEGTSHHYLGPSKYAHASEEITTGLKKILDGRGKKYVTGTSWTTDAPYRETAAEVKQYQEEGVATVEMEASALFAVAQYRGVRMGAMFTVSDSLAEPEWTPQFHFKETVEGMITLCEVALEALSG